MIPVFRPTVGDEEIAAVAEVLKSGWWGLGPKTQEFEQQFARFIGTEYAVGVNSCTAALHLALKVADVEGREVITTPLTFVSTNHAILYNGGIPIFADIEEDTLNIDAGDVARLITERTRAIVVVHYAGHACDMDALLALAKEHDLVLVEDDAHACGGEYRGQRLGSLGDLGCFSFHAVKNLACGDGGMITLNDQTSNERLLRLRWMGVTRSTWDRSERDGYSWEYRAEELGYKCHMNDITAAIGLVQLGKLKQTNARRREIVARYNAAFADLDWMQTPVEKPYARSSWHLYAIKVASSEDRDPLIDWLREHSVSASVHYIPNHLYDMYKPYYRKLPVTEQVWQRLVTLPLFPDLTDAQVDCVIETVRAFAGC